MEEDTSDIYELLKRGYKILEQWPNLPFDVSKEDWNELTNTNIEIYKSYISKIIENNLLDSVYFITDDPKKIESYISRVRSK